MSRPAFWLFLPHVISEATFEHSLVLPFFEIGMKTDLFQSVAIAILMY